MEKPLVFPHGASVKKISGDYVHTGHIVSVFYKRGGDVRYVVEDDMGLLLIMNHKQLEPNAR